MKLADLCRRGLLIALLILCGTVQAALGASGGITVLPDVSVTIQIVNFIFLIWVLNVVLYKPIRNILSKRKVTIEGLEKSVDDFQNDAREKENTWNAGIKEARKSGMQEKEALIQAAEEEERKIIEKINEKAQEDLAEIREKIQKDIEGVRQALQGEVGTFADAIGQKILGRAA